jgi:hypothetical protein
VIAGLGVVPYSRGLLAICDVDIDEGNPETVCGSSHANVMEVV